jgi:hypothetical protein
VPGELNEASCINLFAQMQAKMDAAMQKAKPKEREVY